MEWVTAKTKQKPKKLEEKGNCENRGDLSGESLANTGFDQDDLLASLVSTGEVLGVLFVPHLLKEVQDVMCASLSAVNAMVILGLGNFSVQGSAAHVQLSLVLQLLKHMNNGEKGADEGKVQVVAYDPVFTAAEASFLGSQGITVLERDFNGKHKVRGNDKTLFFMPHCPHRLYSHVLWANWGFNLSKAVVIGNTFSSYELRGADRKEHGNVNVVNTLTPFFVERPIFGENNAVLVEMKKRETFTSTKLEHALVDTSVMAINPQFMRVREKDFSAKMINAHDPDDKDAHAHKHDARNSNEEEEECYIADTFREILSTRRPDEKDVDAAANDDEEFRQQKNVKVYGRNTTSYPKDVKDLFFLPKGFRNFNHGSFGTLPKRVAAHQRALVEEAESHPDRWFRETLFVKSYESRKTLARMVNCNVKHLTLVENASNAVNAVVHTLVDDTPLEQGEKFGVLVFSNAYKMVVEAVELKNCFIVTVPIVFPLEGSVQDIHAGMVRRVDEALSKNPSVKLCIFSHISSMPAMIEPVAALTRVCHTHNAKVLIDGAHAPGQIPVDIMDIQCDYYTGNCHKWMYAPKGSAFFYDATARTRPPVVSSSGQRTFPNNFAYTGTRDYTAFCSIPAAVRFYEQEMGGAEKVTSYSHNLCVQGAKLCAATWGTRLLIPEEMCGNMVNVVLPCRSADVVTRMQARLDREENIYCVGAFIAPEYEALGENGIRAPGALFYMRLSAQPYLTLADFEVLANLVPKLLEEEKEQQEQQQEQQQKE